MSKDEKKSSKEESKGLIREGHNIGDKVKAWQPTVDRTTSPPKGGDKKKD